MSSSDIVTQIVYATPGGRPVIKTTSYRLYFLDTGVEVTYSHEGLREVTLPEILDLCAHHSEKEVRMAWAKVGKDRIQNSNLA